MWDVPIERKAQKEIADQAFGDVLVAGYGLGLIQCHLIKNKKVTSVTTIEKFPLVMKEVLRVYKKIYGKVIIGDFYQLKTNQKYDCVVGDIWEDIVADSLNEYNKFVNKALPFLKYEGKILAWGKDFFDYLNVVRSFNNKFT